MAGREFLLSYREEVSMALAAGFVGDKIWVITGAGSGIGLEMVRIVAKHHGIVWALDRDVAALKALEGEARKNSWDVFTREVDVTDNSVVDAAIGEIRKTSKRIDVWVNNAGIQKVGPFRTMLPEEFNLVLNVNFLAVIAISRRLTEVMEDQGGGVILNMASTAGHVPSPFMTAYVAAKHGVVGFTKALQAELEMLKSPVRAAFASPGFVNTSIIARGKDQGFPEWLSWMLTDAASCAKEIITDLSHGKNEIYPTLSGSMMRAAYAVAPKMTVKGSKVLLTKGIKDLIFNRYQVPR